uniref:Putative ATP-dependent helicase (FANCM) n=1 Tax=uncultured Poseidoniia archaeon TaxID=1697135 RepID=A0A1B1TBQ1_9ARCH|nr:putative ATP-dependent helicase (FANCM) [uncultured Candidatus Thalassoarchaea sp.]
MHTSIQHVNLLSDAIEARAYQLDAVNESLSGSMLLVLPTAAGKTAVAWMLIAEKLIQKVGKILLIAPTVALVNQHLKGINKILALKEIEPISITGQNIANKRAAMWISSRIVIATPQVVRNDIINGILNIEEYSLVIFDEAHHCTGEHAMAQVGRLYNSKSQNPLILGMTASPGSNISQVEEICKNLNLERIHLRTPEDPMISEYLSNLEVQEIKVNVPEEIIVLTNPLILWQKGIVDRERRLGIYIMPGEINHIGLSNAMDRAKKAINRGKKSAYSSISQIGIAMRLHHLINHMLCQGTAASREFLNRLENENGNKSVRNFMRDIRIQKLLVEIKKKNEIHSKVGAVRRLVRERLRRNLDSKIIIFASFRDTITVLDEAMGDLKDARAIQFIGQTNRSSGEGLKPKEQIKRLEEFRSGSANILISTSVGEEGLDIPTADLVIFYEPVSSETRTIQRRGRTGRQREGEIIVLIAEGTRDENARSAALKREKNMHKVVQRVKRKLSLSNHIGENKLNNFKVKKYDEIIDASEFIRKEKDSHAPTVVKFDESSVNIEREEIKRTKLEKFRSLGQTGLDEFN